jgi:hypothetical protein
MVKRGPGLTLAANGRRLQLSRSFTLTNSTIKDYRLCDITAVLWRLGLSKRYETAIRDLAPRLVSPWLILPRSSTGTSKQRQTFH